MANNERLVVTGASGKLGKLVVQELLDKAITNIIATTRTPDRLAEFAAQCVDVRVADFKIPGTLTDAFNGGTRLLLISTLDVGSRIPQHGAAVEAAKAAAVQHVIYTSWPEPQHSVAAVSPDHAGTEELILNSGLKFTFLGNYSYSELLMFSLPKALEGGTLYGAAGTGRAAYVTRQDQAQLEAKFQAIVKPLLAEQHAHMVAVTTGPQTLTEAVEWYQQFASRFVGTLGGGPETEALAQEFRKRRNAQLVAALPEIRLRVQGAKSAEAVGAVLSQCCSLAEDNQVPGVSAVIIWRRRGARRLPNRTRLRSGGGTNRRP